MSNCISRLLTMNGLLSLVYSMAFSRGKPLEWKATKQSQRGHRDTGSWKWRQEKRFPDEVDANLLHYKQDRLYN